MRTILVTGGSGLVGHGIKYANRENTTDEIIYLNSKDADLRDFNETKQLFERYKPTHVVHLAAKVGGLFANMNYKVEFFEDNMMMNMNIVKCCKLYNVEKCISCLSTCIFPDKTSYPIDETMVHNGPPHPSNDAYAYAKRMIDVLNRAYNEEYGCRFTSIIPTNIYGPHDNFNIETGHVIPGLIHKAYNAKRDGTNLTIYGTGKPLRQFLYSYDLGELIMWTLNNYNDMEPIILSVDEEAEMSIGDIARLVAGASDIPDDRVVFDTTKADGQFKKTACNRKLRTLYPDYKFTPIEKGLGDTVQWFKENYDSARR